MTELNCMRCGHIWPQKGDNKPKQCPKCKQYYYDRPAGWEYTTKEKPINIIPKKDGPSEKPSKESSDKVTLE